MFDLVRPNVIAPGIEVFDNAVRNCQQIIQIIESRQEWGRARTGHGEGEISDVRTNDSMFVDFSSLRNPVELFSLGSTIFKYLDDYALRYDFSFARLEDACVNRYDEGQEYHAHADDAPGTPRIVSALLYLNDISDGGDTHFKHFDISVKPKAGRLVIFPSTFMYLHEARPPIGAVKYSVAVWAIPYR